MTESQIDALLALRSGGRLLVGRDRIAILEAIAQHGSITNAAKALGYSYKAAWDAVSAINNLLPKPALVAQAGGRRGGGAIVTEEGHRLIIAFRRLEEKLTKISTLISEDGLDTHPDLLFWSVAMKTSARNVFRCVVDEVRQASVNAEIALRLSDEHSIIALISNESAKDLELDKGRPVIALVKSTFVMLARADQFQRIATPNQMLGTISARSDGGVSSEILLDLGSGKTLVSIINKGSADDLELTPGARACAFFSPSHVILAVD